MVRTMREVADAFEVKTDAVQRWKREGMPAKKVANRKFWYNLDDIYEWKLARDNALVATGNGSRPLNPVVLDAMPRVGELQRNIEDFKLKKADILASEQMSSLDLQHRIKKLKLANLDDEQLMKLTNSEAARWFQLLGVDFAIKYDKEQLERNKGVDNVNKILDVITKIKELDGREGSDSGV